MRKNPYLAAVRKTIDIPWMLYFPQASPIQDISRTTCPIFALNGSIETTISPEVLDDIAGWILTLSD